jgi:hypothetical protein
MGGIIEDKIFEVLKREQLSVRDIQAGLEQIGYRRGYGIINRHLRKMTLIKVLDRERRDGVYVYWDSAMIQEAA